VAGGAISGHNTFSKAPTANAHGAEQSKGHRCPVTPGDIYTEHVHVASQREMTGPQHRVQVHHTHTGMRKGQSRPWKRARGLDGKKGESEKENNMKNKHTHIPYRHVVRSQCPTGTGDEGLRVEGGRV
jgi:hypothetical protein